MDATLTSNKSGFFVSVTSEKESEESDWKPSASEGPQPVVTIADVYLWVSQNPGSKPRDVSEHFGIGGIDASDFCQELLRQGLLDFDE